MQSENKHHHNYYFSFRVRLVLGESETSALIDQPQSNVVNFLVLVPCFVFIRRAPVAQLVEHRAVMREVGSSTPAGPTLRVLK